MADEVEDRVAKWISESDQGGGGNSTELERKFEETERKNMELSWKNLELKEKSERLSREIEKMKGVEAKTNQRVKEMEIEIEQYEENMKVLESISTRALVLETEVVNLRKDLIASINGVDKGVKEMEEKSKKLSLEEEMKEKANERDRELFKLQMRVRNLNLELLKNANEVEKCKSEIKLMEETLSEAQKKEKESELKKEELQKKVEEAKKTMVELSERTKKPSNGVRDTKGSTEAE